jgi:hypothetical protein
MIRRAARPTTRYTVLSNDVLLDTRLSYRARGVLVAILARPDNWRIRSEQLAIEGREGRDAVRAALTELKDHGYLMVEKVRQPDGTFMTEQVVYDTPNATKVLVAPETEKPAPDNQASENQALLQVMEISNENKHMPTLEVGEKTGSSEFDIFWESYPRKVGKTKAQRVWGRLSRVDRLAALQALPEHVTMWRIKQVTADYIPHPTSWLNARRWEDELISAQTVLPAFTAATPTTAHPVDCPGGCDGTGWIETGLRTSAPCPHH